MEKPTALKIDIEKKILFIIIASFMSLALIMIFIHFYYSNLISNNALEAINSLKNDEEKINDYFILLSIKSSFLKVFTLIFLGFIIVLLGALLVLKGIEASYKLSVEKDTYKSALETASPGLVLITFGVLLIVIISVKDYTNRITFGQSDKPDEMSGNVSEKKEERVSPVKSVVSITSVKEDPKKSNGYTPTQSNISKATQSEIDWAMNLEKKVQEGYTPTAEEIEKYSKIAEKVSRGE